MMKSRLLPPEVLQEIQQFRNLNRTTGQLRLRLKSNKDISTAIKPGGPYKLSSAPTYIHGLSWRLVAVKKRRNSELGTVSLYLECDGDAENAEWACYASAISRAVCSQKRVAGETVARPTKRTCNIDGRVYHEKGKYAEIHFFAGHLLDENHTLRITVDVKTDPSPTRLCAVPSVSISHFAERVGHRSMWKELGLSVLGAGGSRSWSIQASKDFFAKDLMLEVDSGAKVFPFNGYIQLAIEPDALAPSVAF